MALETVTIKDAANVSQNILVDKNGSGDSMQAVKLMLGADGVFEFVSIGQATKANSLPVAIASDQDPLPALNKAANSSCTNVGVAAADTAVLALNADRKGAIIHNDGAATVYLKYGTGASATSFTYKLLPGDTWEMPSTIYTGAINHLGSAATGTLRVTELT